MTRATGPGHVRCPHCGERNPTGAVACRECSEALPGTTSGRTAARPRGARPQPTSVTMEFGRRQQWALGALAGVAFLAALVQLDGGLRTIDPVPLLIAAVGGAGSLAVFCPTRRGRDRWLGAAFGVVSGLGAYGLALVYFHGRTTFLRIEAVIPLLGAVPGVLAYLAVIAASTRGPRAPA